jgi:hypothetical protein
MTVAIMGAKISWGFAVRGSERLQNFAVLHSLG